MTGRVGWSPGPAHWKDDLTPIAAADWSYDRAAHLLAHAGFGGAPAEIEALAGAGPDGAVRALVHYERIPNPKLQPFVESGLWDPSLNPFPESRPEATDRALATGASMGVERKPARGETDYRPDFIQRYLAWGAGPRASQYLILAGKARAILQGRTHVTPGSWLSPSTSRSRRRLNSATMRTTGV